MINIVYTFLIIWCRLYDYTFVNGQWFFRFWDGSFITIVPVVVIPNHVFQFNLTRLVVVENENVTCRTCGIFPFHCDFCRVLIKHSRFKWFVNLTLLLFLGRRGGELDRSWYFTEKKYSHGFPRICCNSTWYTLYPCFVEF